MTQSEVDELHFVTCCKKLKEVRDDHITTMLNSNPEADNMKNIEKLKWLLSKGMLDKLAQGTEALFCT